MFCFAVWACGRFFPVWAGGRAGGGGGREFFAVWAGNYFCCLVGGRVICFAVWAGACVSVLLFGPGWSCFFLLFGRGAGVHSLTGLPGSSLTGPTTKKDQTAKQKKIRVHGPQGPHPTFQKLQVV